MLTFFFFPFQTEKKIAINAFITVFILCKSNKKYHISAFFFTSGTMNNDQTVDTVKGDKLFPVLLQCHTDALIRGR